MSLVSLSRERSLHTAFTERSLQIHRRDLANYQEQLSTGKRVNRASDDALAYGQARQMEVLSERYTQYQRSIDSARAWTSHTQDALNEMAEYYMRAYELGVQGSNGTFDQADRNIVAGELRAIQASVLDRLNADFNGEYLFAGTRTTEQPFDDDPTSGTYGEPTVGAANIADLDGARVRQVGPGVEITVNISGQNVYESGSVDNNIIEDLQKLIDAFSDDDDQDGTPDGVPYDPAATQAALGQVIQARDHLIDRGAAAGNAAERLHLTDLQLRQSVLNVEARRSELEDADVAKVYTETERITVSLQAALKATASIMRTTLADYL